MDTSKKQRAEQDACLDSPCHSSHRLLLLLGATMLFDWHKSQPVDRLRIPVFRPRMIQVQRQGPPSRRRRRWRSRGRGLQGKASPIGGGSPSGEGGAAGSQEVKARAGPEAAGVAGPPSRPKARRVAACGQSRGVGAFAQARLYPVN